MKYKYLIFIAAALLWFFLVGFFYSEKKELSHWVATLFVYVIGGRWVFAGIFKKTMYTPYTGSEIKCTRENALYRQVLIFVGFSLMLASSLM